MKKVKIGKNEVCFYDTPEMMPMRRYQRFNKFLMIQNEVGSDFEDYNRRSAKGIAFLKQGLVKEAIQELSNQRQMVFNSFQEYSPQGRALAILVYSINGVVFDDYSKDGLDQVLDKLEKIGFTQSQSTKTVDEVKKKSNWNWLHIFQRNSKNKVNTNTITNY